jgi:Bacterial EndoU nuclease
LARHGYNTDAASLLNAHPEIWGMATSQHAINAGPAQAGRAMGDPAQLAQIDLYMADPQVASLMQAYGGTPEPARSSVALEQVRLYGQARYEQMTRMANAMQSVREQYVAALHQAQEGGTGTGWVVQRLPVRDSTGQQVLDEAGQVQLQDQPVFDTDTFTAWYTQQNGLAQQAFKSLFGNSHTTTSEVVRHSANSGDTITLRAHTRFDNPAWLIDINGEMAHTELITLDLNNKPSLRDDAAVGFDLRAGWVTSSANLYKKQDWIDIALPLIIVAVVSYFSAGTLGPEAAGAMGLTESAAATAATATTAATTTAATTTAATTTAVTATVTTAGTLTATGMVVSAAIAGAATSLVSGMLYDNLSFKGVLIGALTGALSVKALQELSAALPAVNMAAGTAGGFAANFTVQTGIQALIKGKLTDQMLLTTLASTLGSSLAANMEAGILDAKLQGAEAFAARGFAKVLTSAVRAMANPNDPNYGFASALLDSVVNGGLGALDAAAHQEGLDQRNQMDMQSDEAHDARAAQQSDDVLARRGREALEAGSAAGLAGVSQIADFDNRTLLNDAERLANPNAYASVAGRSQIAAPGQSISSMLGTSDPQAIGNFMRANNLSTDMLQLGRAYFVPDSATAYGNAVQLGQATLNAGNSRLEQARQRQAQLDNAGVGGGASSATPGLNPLPTSADALSDAQTQTQRILQYAQVRNSDLSIGTGPEAGAAWARRAEELLTVALQYKALNKPSDGRPFTSDSIYNGLVADALQARAMAGVGIDRSALEQTAKLLIESGEAGQIGVAAAGAFAARAGRVPITAQGQANQATAEQLRADLSNRAGVHADTSRDADYIARTDPRVATNNKFDWDHVLAGEVNAAGRATGYHAENAAEGAARIAPNAKVTQNPNGTYEAPVQIWSEGNNHWIDKPRESTFFPADWSRARIEFEVSEAFKVKVPGARGEVGTTPSGIRIQFFWDATNQRTTFYPFPR